jgi:hypothetical protein
MIIALGCGAVLCAWFCNKWPLPSIRTAAYIMLSILVSRGNSLQRSEKGGYFAHFDKKDNSSSMSN